MSIISIENNSAAAISISKDYEVPVGTSLVVAIVVARGDVTVNDKWTYMGSSDTLHTSAADQTVHYYKLTELDATCNLTVTHTDESEQLIRTSVVCISNFRSFTFDELYNAVYVKPPSGKAMFTITAPVGAVININKDGETLHTYALTGDETEHTFEVDNTTTYEVAITDGENIVIQQVPIGAVDTCYIMLTFGSTANITINGPIETDSISAVIGNITYTPRWDAEQGCFIFDSLGTLGEYVVRVTRGNATIKKSIVVEEYISYSAAMLFTLYLYNEGDTCDDVSGGWTGKGTHSNSSGSVTMNADNMQLYYYYAYISITGATVDLTNFSTLKAIVKQTTSDYRNAYVGVGNIDESGTYKNVKIVYIPTGSNYTEVEIDVSDCVGEHRVVLGGHWYYHSSGYVYAKKIWLVADQSGEDKHVDKLTTDNFDAATKTSRTNSFTFSNLTDQFNGSDGISIVGRSTISSTFSDRVYLFNMGTVVLPIDLTAYDTLALHYRKSANHGNISIRLTDEEPTETTLTSATEEIVELGYGNAPTDWTKVEYDVSDKTGVWYLCLRGGYSDVTGNTSSTSQYCNISLIGSAKVYDVCVAVPDKPENATMLWVCNSVDMPAGCNWLTSPNDAKKLGLCDHTEIMYYDNGKCAQQGRTFSYTTLTAPDDNTTLGISAIVLVDQPTHEGDTGYTSLQELKLGFEDDNWKEVYPNIYTVTNASTVPWLTDSTFQFYDANTLRSGAIGNNAETVLTIEFELYSAGSITFPYIVSSEANYDWFTVVIDGTQELRVSGTDIDTWTIFTKQLSAGMHTVTFKYSKNSGTVAGKDAVAIAYIILKGIKPDYKTYYIVRNDATGVYYSIVEGSLHQLPLDHEPTFEDFLEYGGIVPPVDQLNTMTQFTILECFDAETTAVDGLEYSIVGNVRPQLFKCDEPVQATEAYQSSFNKITVLSTLGEGTTLKVIISPDDENWYACTPTTDDAPASWHSVDYTEEDALANGMSVTDLESIGPDEFALLYTESVPLVMYVAFVVSCTTLDDWMVSRIKVEFLINE